MTPIKYLYSKLIGIILIFSAISPGYSQAGLNISYGTVLDGNAYRNYENISDVIYQPQLSLFYNYSFENGNVRFFYNGSVFLFDEFTTRRYFFHNIGVTGTWRSYESAPLMLWGIQGSRRFNQDEYVYYNYELIQGYVNFRFDKNTTNDWVMGTQLKYRNYKELPEFSFLESAAFIRSSFFLKTRTTIITNIQAGYKEFIEPVESYEYIEEMDLGQSGRGKGKGKGGNASGQGEVHDRTVQVESEGSSVFQLFGSLRIAQSLAAKTGMALEAAMQRNPSGGVRVLSGQDSGYETNDELYDDSYSYDMEEISLELTQILPWSIRLKLGSSYTVKKYDRPVYDPEGNILEGTQRKDTVPVLWAYFEKTLRIKGFARSLLVFLNYLYLNNESNDEYYSYSNQIISLGCSVTI